MTCVLGRPTVKMKPMLGDETEAQIPSASSELAPAGDARRRCSAKLANFEANLAVRRRGLSWSAERARPGRAHPLGCPRCAVAPRTRAEKPSPRTVLTSTLGPRDTCLSLSQGLLQLVLVVSTPPFACFVTACTYR